jgi:hypothetical protein
MVKLTKKEIALIKKSLLNQKIQREEYLTYYRIMDKLDKAEKIKNKSND